MLSIFRIQKGKGAAKYYKNLSKYYGTDPSDGSPDGPPPSGLGIITKSCLTKWLGTGASMLGLSGTVRDDDLESLFAGYDPISGVKLVQNAGSSGRQPAWDHTYSAPKSVSVVWARLHGLPEAEELLEAHQDAVASSIKFIEDQLSFCRVGKSGVDLRFERAKIVAPTFTDFVSRALDPQMHSHVPIVNIGVWLDDGKTRTNALDVHLNYQFKKLNGAWYRLKLANRVIKLGYEVEQDGESWRINNTPRDVEKEKSTRRQQILEHMEESGVFDAVQAAKSALATRPNKVDIPFEEIQQEWDNDFERLGFAVNDAKMLKTGRAAKPIEPIKLVRDAVTELSTTQAHFLYTEALYASLIKAPPYEITPEQIQDALAEIIDSELVYLGIDNGQPRYTTQKTLSTERKLIDAVGRLRRKKGAKARQSAINWVLLRSRKTSGQQAQAIRELTSGTSSIRVLDGYAGVGKTRYVLNQVGEAFRLSGYRVLAIAHTGTAAKQLNSGISCLSEPARTVASALGKWELSTGQKVKHHAKEFAKESLYRVYGVKTKRFRLPRPDPIKLNRKTVLIVDEASMINTEDFIEIVTRAERAQATIISTSDWMQLPPVEETSPTAYLTHNETEIVSTIDEVQRQKLVWQQQTVKAFRERNVRKALRLLDSHGCISKSSDHEQRLEAALNDWEQCGLRTPLESVIIAHTNEVVNNMNRRCQERRLAGGFVDGSKSVIVKDTCKNTGAITRARVHVGDTVYFTQNSSHHGVKNGTRGIVHKIKGRTLYIRTSDNNPVIISAKEYPFLRLGYASTDYRFQGGTIENVYIIPGNDIHNAYVSVSRASERIKLFVTDQEFKTDEESGKSHLEQRLGKAIDLRLASEFRMQRIPETQSHRPKPVSLLGESSIKNRKINPAPPLELKNRKPIAPQSEESKLAELESNIFGINKTAPTSVCQVDASIKKLKITPAPPTSKAIGVTKNQKRALAIAVQPSKPAKKEVIIVPAEKLPITSKVEGDKHKPYSGYKWDFSDYEERRKLGVKPMAFKTRRAIQNSRMFASNGHAQPVSDQYDDFAMPENDVPINLPNEKIVATKKRKQVRKPKSKVKAKQPVYRPVLPDWERPEEKKQRLEKEKLKKRQEFLRLQYPQVLGGRACNEICVTALNPFY